MTNKKLIVTARNILTDQHVYIKCNDSTDTFNTAHQFHLKSHVYVQIRLRSTEPSKRIYKQLLEKFEI